MQRLVQPQHPFSGEQGAVILRSARAFVLGILGLFTFLAVLGWPGGSFAASPAAFPESNRPGVRQAITRTWENLGLYGAVISAIAIDTNHNPPTGTVYAGTTSGDGLYRSLDGGVTWEGVYTASVQALAVNDRDGVVWGIGERGVITSGDGGATWAVVASPLHGWARLAVVNRVTVLANGDQVARSQDGGATWDTATLPCTGCQAQAVSLDTHRARILVATDDEIYASPLSPLAFTLLSTGSGMANLISLAASPHITDVVLAGTGDTGGSGVRHALFESTDGGATWSKAGDLGRGVGYIVYHPVFTQTVYAGGFTYDLGTKSLSPLGFGAGNSHFAIYPTAPYTMFGAIDQGVNRSVDGGATFFPSNHGIDGVTVQDFTQNPRDLGLYFVNTKSGLGRTFNGGKSWDFPLGYTPGSPSQPVGSHFGGAAAAPYRDAAYTSRAFLGELFTSDYGDTTQPLGNPTSLRQSIEGSGCINCSAFINSVAVDPGDPLRVYAGVGGHHIPTGDAELPYGGVWESTDGGNTWAGPTAGYSASYGSLPITTPVRLVAFAQSGVAYAGVGDFRNHTDFGGGMYGGVISRTTSTTWDLLDTVTNPITAPVVGLAIDPNNPLHIWAGTESVGSGSSATPPHLYRSDDGGVSWEDRTPAGADGGFLAIAVHPTNSNIVFAAAQRQMFFTRDAGVTWARLPDPPSGSSASAEPIQRILLPILPPAPVQNVTATVTSGVLSLSWTNPSDPRFQGVIIRGDSTQAPRTSIEGSLLDTVAAPGTASSVTLPANPYFLSVIPYDASGRYGIGVHLAVNGSSVSVTARSRHSEGRSRAASEPAAQQLDVLVGTATGLYQMDVGDLVDQSTQGGSVFLPLILAP